MNPLFSLFRRRKAAPVAAEVAVLPKPEARSEDDPINEKVRWVAQAFGGDLTEFRARAAEAAAALGPSSIEHLATLFHTEHTPPSSLGVAASGLGQWMTARQFAIFEIFYNFGAASLAVLERVAFGEYDWTQGNAIEILCRLAAQDVSRQEIVNGLIEHLPSMREEAHYYALGPLLHQAKENQAIGQVLSELLVVPEFKMSYEEVTSSPGKA
jgi:hypothetical protein